MSKIIKTHEDVPVRYKTKNLDETHVAAWVSIGGFTVFAKTYNISSHKDAMHQIKVDFAEQLRIALSQNLEI